ncbi:MAG: rhodanese-like domain-containing protein [Haloplanus sp.]
MAGDLRVVTPEWLASNDGTVTVVDVREPRDYDDVGHVPGAVNVPFERFRDPSSVSTGRLPDPTEFERILSDAGIEPTDPVVAYDDETGVYAARFLLTAAVFGHRGELCLLDGGLEAWRTVGATETATPDRESTAYDIGGLDEETVVDREAVEAAVASDAVLVDTRTPAEYAQSHIPGAVQVGQEELLDDGRLRPDDDIEALLAANGIERGKRIVLYCNTARRLSHTYVVLRYLGYEDVAFYEGSLTDWVRAESADWDPVQLYENVRDLAPEGVEALPRELGDDVFGRLHLIGLYTQKQDGYFMLRTKVPCGRLTAEQARTFGEIADEFATAPPEHGGAEQNPEFGDGFLDVTTRQGLQLHWIRIEDMPEIWDRYDEVGLTSVQASGNTLRNVVTCPAAGLGDEVCDVGPLGERIAERFEGDRELANLPRKLKVSLSGCHEDCGRAAIHDIGFAPAVKDGRDGFHVRVGGGLSDGPRVATDLGVFVERDDVEELVLGVADLFIDHGSYLDTAVNRLKFLVDEWGVEQFREELQRYVDFTFEPAGEDLTTAYRGDHVGVHPQDDGGYYLGLNVPTGRMPGTDLIELADLAETYGSGELRTTANQNLLLPNVDETDLDALRAEPLLDRYSPDPGPFTRGIVTCTGAEFCSYGVVETKTRGLRWARALDDWVEGSDRIERSDLPDAVRVHVSGCAASCAQPQIADFGLRGERHRDDDAEVPAADVGVGGDLSHDEFLDWVAGSLPLSDVPAAIQRTLLAYERERDADESFADWTRRTSLAELQAVLTGRRGTSVAAEREVR